MASVDRGFFVRGGAKTNLLFGADYQQNSYPTAKGLSSAAPRRADTRGQTTWDSLVVRPTRVALQGSGTDYKPPSFSGITLVNNATGSTLQAHWNAAADDVSDPSTIVYEVRWSTTTGFETSGAADIGVAYSSAGATNYTITGLAAKTTYYVTVRARDQAGNVDHNTVEASGTTVGTTLTATPSDSITVTDLVGQTLKRTASDSASVTDTVTGAKISDTTPPTFAGANSCFAISGTSILLGWAAASDDFTPPSGIVYDIYQASFSTGENYASPTHTTAPGATSYVVSGLTANTPYWFVVRARDAAGNRDSNVVEVTAITTGDTTPPTIGNYIPAIGTTITPGTPIQFDVTDNQSSFRRTFIEVLFQDSTGIAEVVHDGDGFRGLYQASSSRTVISGGFRYIIRRTGGWPGTPTFKTYSIDTNGNEGTSL